MWNSKESPKPSGHPRAWINQSHIHEHHSQRRVKTLGDLSTLPSSPSISRITTHSTTSFARRRSLNVTKAAPQQGRCFSPRFRGLIYLSPLEAMAGSPRKAASSISTRQASGARLNNVTRVRGTVYRLKGLYWAKASDITSILIFDAIALSLDETNSHGNKKQK